MITFKQYITEKSVRGIRVKRYLINPTPNEFVSFMSNTQYKSMRLLEYEGDLYAWDTWNTVHEDFLETELFMNDPNILYDVSKRANIDPFENSEGTRIHKKFMKSHKKWMEKVVTLLERKYDGDFVLRHPQDYDLDSNWIVYTLNQRN